ncbi:Protein of uncharacterised function (DUF2693) [Acinetobacter baumannii]|nr:Protein of uncharacterised function (DUF2693) [Acinetobacter baumannii]
MSLNLTQLGYRKLHSHVATVLHSGTHQIVFQKKNGDIRVIQGTLDPGVLAQKLGDAFDETSVQVIDESVKTSLPVYDVELNDWRSFSLDNVIGIDGININTLLKHAQINLEEE